MSPILVRPVREQFEHDRVIRILHARYKRKYEVISNPGAEQNAAVGIGELPMHPDLVLFSLERGRKIQGTVEVETSESINTLEAMSEWVPFSRLRAPFFLYVPVNSIDSVRRLCSDFAIAPAEIWTYHSAMDQMRFTMVHRAPESKAGASRAREPRRPDQGVDEGVDGTSQPLAAGAPLNTEKRQPTARVSAAAATPSRKTPTSAAARPSTAARAGTDPLRSAKGPAVTRAPKGAGSSSRTSPGSARAARPPARLAPRAGSTRVAPARSGAPRNPARPRPARSASGPVRTGQGTPGQGRAGQGRPVPSRPAAARAGSGAKAPPARTTGKPRASARRAASDAAAKSTARKRR